MSNSRKNRRDKLLTNSSGYPKSREYFNQGFNKNDVRNELTTGFYEQKDKILRYSGSNKMFYD